MSGQQRKKAIVTIRNGALRNIILNERVIGRLAEIADVDWVPEDKPFSSEELAEMIGPYDICITGWSSPKIDARVLERASRLAFVGHTAGSLVPFLSPEAYARGITVVNANEALARSTAECAVAMMMAGAWQLREYHDRLQGGGWADHYRESVMGLYRQTVGIVGLGAISREVIRLLQPYEPRILLCSSHCDEREAARLGVELADLDTLLKTCRIVSLHATLTPATEGMIGERELALLQDGALLVNTARGEIVQEAPLLRELSSGRIRAVLDVYPREPLAADSPWLRLSHAFCLPHIGGLSRYWKEQLGSLVVEDVLRWYAGLPPLRPVSEEQIRRMSLH